MSHLERIHDSTPTVYERNAQGWDKSRSRHLVEASWLDRFTRLLPPGCAILDVGCGAGEPISRYLIEKGFALTGIDASPAMIGICQSRFPDAEWMVMDMRNLSLDRTFGGIVAWDSFFHLNPSEQRSVLPQFMRCLQSGGALLITVGHEASEVLGTVENEEVYHSSLSPKEYKGILNTGGLQDVEIVFQDPNCGHRSVLLAQ
ncbi:MAG: class I SAM-dependent methyltransferase [Armatimonadaceae bacterium]